MDTAVPVIKGSTTDRAVEVNVYIRRPSVSAERMNLAHALERTARRQPETRAISGRGAEGGRTYAEVADRVERLATGLGQLGIEAGGRVAILMKNHAAFVETSFATYRLGAIKVPLNSMLTPSEHELLVSDAGADTLVVETSFLDHCKEIDVAFDTVVTVDGDGSDVPFAETVREYEELVTETPPEAEVAAVSLDDRCALMYTSGTTGRPKGVQHTHGTWLSAALGLKNVLEQGEGEVTLHAAPLTHGSGFLVESTVLAGGTNHVQDGFEPKRFLETVEDVGVNTVFVAPTMIYKLLDNYDGGDEYETDSLQSLYYAGSPMTAARIEEGIEKLGNVFVQSYGQMEVPMLVTVLDREDHRLAARNEDHQSRFQSAGREVDIAHLRIVNENGESVPTGEVGEIVVKAPHVTPGYWNLPDKTEETFSDGWLHTGDMARLDEDGYLYIMDRKKDMIITGGMNVYPREIEEVIVEHEIVSNAAAIGVPDDYWGEKVTAIVEPRPDETIEEGILAEEVLELCEGRLAAYKKPKEIEIVEELPRNSYGKVLKTDLREKHWDETDRNVN